MTASSSPMAISRSSSRSFIARVAVVAALLAVVATVAPIASGAPNAAMPLLRAQHQRSTALVAAAKPLARFAGFFSEHRNKNGVALALAADSQQRSMQQPNANANANAIAGAGAVRRAGLPPIPDASPECIMAITSFSFQPNGQVCIATLVSFSSTVNMTEVIDVLASDCAQNPMACSTITTNFLAGFMPLLEPLCVNNCIPPMYDIIAKCATNEPMEVREEIAMGMEMLSLSCAGNSKGSCLVQVLQTLFALIADPGLISQLSNLPRPTAIPDFPDTFPTDFPDFPTDHFPFSTDGSEDPVLPNISIAGCEFTSLMEESCTPECVAIFNDLRKDLGCCFGSFQDTLEKILPIALNVSDPRAFSHFCGIPEVKPCTANDRKPVPDNGGGDNGGNSGTDPAEATSAGRQLAIAVPVALAVFVVAFFVFGTVYKRYVHRTRGWDSIPFSHIFFRKSNADNGARSAAFVQLDEYHDDDDNDDEMLRA